MLCLDLENLLCSGRLQVADFNAERIFQPCWRCTLPFMNFHWLGSFDEMCNNTASCWISVKWIKTIIQKIQLINPLSRAEDCCTSDRLIEKKSAITEDCKKYIKKWQEARAVNIAKHKKNNKKTNSFVINFSPLLLRVLWLQRFLYVCINLFGNNSRNPDRWLSVQ